jgi:hypothetical protein
MKYIKLGTHIRTIVASLPDYDAGEIGCVVAPPNWGRFYSGIWVWFSQRDIIKNVQPRHYIELR